MAKDKAPRVTSPRGILRFPKLVVPDEYLGKKQFVTGLIVPEETAKPFIDKIKKLTAEYRVKMLAEAKDAKAKKKLEEYRVYEPWDIEEDEDGSPTGNVIFDFKASYQYEDKKTKEMQTNAIRFFDSFLRPCKVNPWGGTEAVISADLCAFHNPAGEKYGVSLRIAGVQVIKLVSGSGGDAKSLGFSAQEDGFAAEEDSEGDPTSEPSPADADSGNGDF